MTPDLEAALAAYLQENRWGLWCTLYTDASNAGSESNGPRTWAWGARARLSDQVAALFEAPAYLTGSGGAPQAGSLGSHVGEMWAVVHGVSMVLERWPFVRGIGVRSDNQAACCTSNTPLIAALMVCWVALLRLGRALPPELDELIGGSLERGSLHPQSFGVTWAEVDTLYSSGGRTPPAEVLARAAVELASGRGAQRVRG